MTQLTNVLDSIRSNITLFVERLRGIATEDQEVTDVKEQVFIGGEEV